MLSKYYQMHTLFNDRHVAICYWLVGTSWLKGIRGHLGPHLCSSHLGLEEHQLPNLQEDQAFDACWLALDVP